MKYQNGVVVHEIGDSVKIISRKYENFIGTIAGIRVDGLFLISIFDTYQYIIEVDYIDFVPYQTDIERFYEIFKLIKGDKK